MQSPAIPLTVMDNEDAELFGELLEAVRTVAASGQFIGGRFVETFEEAFALACEAQYAVGVSSGTEALVLALRALGLTTGDEVIVPANSFIATAEAVYLAGGSPRFADVDETTQVVTAETLERAHGPRVRGLIPVHLFGRTVEMPEIVELGRSWGAWVLEDCAQAQGARYAGRPVGTWGDAAAFSFYPAKNLGAWGDAGAVVTNREDIADRVRLLRSHGERPRYEHRMVGTTGRLDAIQAAVLERKLGRLEQWNRDRRRIARELDQVLAQADAIDPPPPPSGDADHVYHQYVVRCKARDALREHLASRGIATAIHYPVPIHRSIAFAAAGMSHDAAPTATALAAEICSLPIFPSMSAAQIERMGDTLAQFVN